LALPAHADFRNFAWYTDLGDVKRREIGDLIREYTIGDLTVLVYETELVDLPVEAHFVFDDLCGQLYRAGYIFDYQITLSKYNLIIATLTEKYGEPGNTPPESDGSDAVFYVYEKQIYDWTTETSNIVASWTRRYDFFLNSLSESTTAIEYRTVDFVPGKGFKPGTKPACDAKQQIRNRLRRDL
jgi:hypothetical protein